MTKNKKISVAICAFNEEENIERCLKSLKWVDEIVVVDPGSTDKTSSVAGKYTDKIFTHKNPGFVEPLRNFSIQKTTGEFVLVIDADEEISSTLAKKLREIAENNSADIVKIPRKNFIFGKWMQASMWWPDYHVRFFKKGKVVWGDGIHSVPKVEGREVRLDLKEENAIIHHNYDNLSEFVKRNSYYSKIQAKELFDSGYRFVWTDLVRRPLGEFLGRFFANKGYKDGLHGLALSMLQAFMFLLQYIYIWELQEYKDQEISLKVLKKEAKSAGKELKYWFDFSNFSRNPTARFFQKIKNKIS